MVTLGVNLTGHVCFIYPLTVIQVPLAQEASRLCRSFSTSRSGLSTDENLVKIGFVGAGGVSFGTKEGPWNHSVRLEKMPNVAFTAIIDPNLALAQACPVIWKA
jgi:hypothetical protein